MMMDFRFNVAKSAQAAALLLRLNGGDMDKYLFIKMLYLADRTAISKWGDPITGDTPVSMPYGPVLSTIYDLTKGDCPVFRAEWSKFISDADEETNQILLHNDPGTDELSRSEVGILTAIFEEYRDFSWKKMRDFSHRLEEYEEVGRGSKRIPFVNILKALGKEESEIRECQDRLRQMVIAEALLA